MGLLQIQNLPDGTGPLISVETLPMLVEANPAFEEAKLILEKMIATAGNLPNSITTMEDYDKGMRLLQALTVFLKNVEAGIAPMKDKINGAKNRLMELQHELDVPAANLKLALSRETARYQLWQAEQARIESDRLQREAEKERMVRQRQAEIDALMTEIGTANQAGDEAVARGQSATRDEIVAGISRLVKLLGSAVTTAQIANPVAEITKIRQVVALAVQHEQARIAAAAAIAQGDRKTAKQIEKASMQLVAPEVEEVYVAPVQVAPVMARKPELYKAAGASVTALWRVKTIFDAARVCREHPELCEPSESKLNDFAKRTKQKPNIPGVEWEQDVRTRGVR